jgi:anti-anti-sigma factor
MQISEEQHGPIWVLKLDGRLDHAGAQVFQACVDRLIDSGARAMIVDFGGIGFLASMGIRALIAPSQKLSQIGGRLAITGLNDSTRGVFEMAGLLQIFTTYPEVA